MAFLKRHRFAVACALLAVATAVGLYSLFSADWRGALRFWSGRGGVFAAVLALHTLNLVTDGFLWLWLLSGFGIRPGLRRGAVIFLAGFAGLLFPAQLGRLVRSEELARLGHGRFADAAKAEVVMLALIAATAFAVLAAVSAGLWRTWAAAPAALGVTAGFLCCAALGMRLAPRMTHLLPAGYFLRPSMIAAACLAAVGWILSGFGLLLILHEIVPGVVLWQTLIVSPSSMLLGSASGMPGGLGVVEGYLGVAFHSLHVPAEHLALAVAAFRLITFWLWIPVGWVALTCLGRLPSDAEAAQDTSVNKDVR